MRISRSILPDFTSPDSYRERFCGYSARTLLLFTFVLSLNFASATPFVSKDSLSSVSTPMVGFDCTRAFPEITRLSSNQSFDPITIQDIADDSLQQKRARAHSLREDVEKAQRFRETLDAFSVIDLPLGVVRSGGLVDYSIIIDKITFTPQGSILDAYVSFTIPQTGDRIAFGGLVPLSRDGGIVGTAKIYLLGDHYVKLSETSLLTLVGSKDRGTFVEIDCNGFKGMSIEATVEFSKDILVPEDAQGKAKENERLKVNFQTYVQDWNELLVKVNMPPFQIKGLQDVGFQIEDAYLDWSDLTNPQGLTFPPDYESAYLTSGNNNLWRGFFLKKAQVRLPNKFSEAGGGQRTAIGVENMIVDDTGFSGKIFAEYLVQAGDMNGWSFTLDRFKAGIVSNQLKEFELAGQLTVPAFKKEGKDAQMGYRASRGANGNYIFAVSLADEVKLPLWAADVSLYRGSAVTVKEKNDKFYPSASLNGMISIKALNKGPKADIAGVRFENLVLSTEAPYFRPGTFGVGSAEEGAKASGFPLVIKNIGIKSNTAEQKVGLSMDVTVNIGGNPSEEGFSGTAGLIVWGDMNSTSPPTTVESPSTGTGSKWQFDRVELTALGISIKKPGVFVLAGQVRFFDNDPIYGDGFNGQLSGEFGKGIKAQANAIFGKTTTYRYWFADALVTIDGGVALAPGLGAYGFSGGFYSKMKQAARGSGSVIGQTASGITYLPDENSMGLRAYMAFGSYPKKEALNGDVTFGIEMNRHGGINRVSLDGSAYFLTPQFSISADVAKRSGLEMAEGVKNTVDKLVPKSQVYGSVKLLFDNQNDVFHGDIEVYVNVVGGLVKGIGDGNKAGWAVLHFSPGEWYVLIGTPDQPIGLEVARLFKAKSYFMMGKNLPGSPPPPAKVSEILGGVDLDYMRDMNSLESGLGLAFGMAFSVDTGDLRFLMFYGRFAAGAGFDIMLKNYGTSFHCEGSNEPMGINGWYANGQAYAYVEGKIGIRVNLRFYKGDFDILAIGAAAVLQAKGPNPFWMRGTVGGYYRILGGLVKGHCRFDVTVGKECKPVGEQELLADVSIIAEVSPGEGVKDVDVFVVPQAAFNIPIGEVFNVTDAQKKAHKFRATLKEFSLNQGSTKVAGVLKWNDKKDVLVIDTEDILYPFKNYEAKAVVVFEEFIGNQWVPSTFKGKIVEETVSHKFTSGEAPDMIPANNIDLAYPLPGQFNFYPKEWPEGFIKLKKGQPYLFEKKPGIVQKARLSGSDAVPVVDFDYSYDNSTKKVTFGLPDLELQKAFYLDLVDVPTDVLKDIDRNVETKTNEVSSAAGNIQVSSKTITRQLTQREVKSIYNSYFRTSKYQSFREKIGGLTLSNSFTVDQSINVFRLSAYLRGDEFFDANELGLLPGIDQSMILEIDLKNSPWYKEDVFPLLYEGYPLLGHIKLNRDTSLLGLPPVRSAVVTQSKNGFWFDSNDLAQIPIYDGVTTLNNDLMLTMPVDYYDLQSQVADIIVDHPDVFNPRLGRLIFQPFPVMRRGPYDIHVKYLIPGIAQPSSTTKWTLNKR
ncbi:MAG: hypothetical protein R2820_12145 [Cyclobacteriaceae bacterium]